MKLIKARVKNFKSIQDSTEFDIDDRITCLVGKNQAGKTALLEALNSQSGIVDLTYTLENEDCQTIKERFGDECLKDEHPTITVKNNNLHAGLNVDLHAAVRYLIENTNLPKEQKDKLIKVKDIEAQIEAIEVQHTLLTEKEQIEDSEKEQINDLNRLRSRLQSITQNGLPNIIYTEILQARIPQFRYIKEYHEIEGKVNLTELQNRINNRQPNNSDDALRAIIDDTTLQQILRHGTNSSIAQEEHIFIKNIENKANKALTFWSQNESQEIKVKIYNESNNWWIDLLVENTRNNARIPSNHESHGFLWFFSFLLWYQQLLQENPNLILLLDEPALSLHGTAQEDMLICLEEYLAPKHQIIYTTHSPFMIDINNLDRIRVVENLSLEQNREDSSTKEQGTKVTSNILQAKEKSILPIQSAVGFNINQIHGKGQNVFIVEGESDVLYIKTISKLLPESNNAGINTNWDIIPSDSIDKIVSTIKQYHIAEKTIGKKFNIAVLTDYHQEKHQTHANINKELKENGDKASIRKFFTYKDFVGKEADVEDMFTPKFYLDLVNSVYSESLTESDLSKSQKPHINSRLEERRGKKHNHKKIAEYFKDNIDSLEKKLDDPTLDRFQKLFDTLNQLLVPQTSK